MTEALGITTFSMKRNDSMCMLSSWLNDQGGGVWLLWHLGGAEAERESAEETPEMETWNVLARKNISQITTQLLLSVKSGIRYEAFPALSPLPRPLFSFLFWFFQLPMPIGKASR